MFIFGAAAAVLFVGFVFAARAKKHHAKSLNDAREEYRQRIETMESELDEEIKEIPSSQQILLLRTAVEDLLRLNGKAGGYVVSADGMVLTVACPDDLWTIRFTGRETRLRTVRKTLHGHELWLLQGKQRQIQFDDIRDLMATLNAWMKEGGELSGQDIRPFSQRAGRHHAARLNKPASRPTEDAYLRKAT